MSRKRPRIRLTSSPALIAMAAVMAGATPTWAATAAAPAEAEEDTLQQVIVTGTRVKGI